MPDANAFLWSCRRSRTIRARRSTLGLRETINEKPKVAMAVIGGIVVLIFVLIFTNMSGSSQPAPQPSSGSQKAFFTDDDGAKWFADDITKVPPFERGGKQVVLARVYRCGGKEFVNHMERYTPEGKKKAEEIYAKGTYKTDPTAIGIIQQTGLEVKAPGAGAWVKIDSPKAADIMRPKCPGGASDESLELVIP